MAARYTCDRDWEKKVKTAWASKCVVVKRQEEIPEGLQFQKWAKEILSASQSCTGVNDLSGGESAQVPFACLNLSVK